MRTVDGISRLPTEIMNYNELIQAMSNGILNANDVQKIIDMQKSKEKLFEKYGIKEIKRLGGSDQRCYVRIKDQSYADGYKKITGSTEETLWENIKQYDIEKEKKNKEPTFSEWFNLWKSRQEEGKKRSPNTIDKYRSDYNRVFLDSKIENWKIIDIDSDELEHFLLQRYTEKKNPKRAAKDINGMIRGMFKFAFIKKKIETNICDYVDWEVIVSQCDNGKKDEEWKCVFENDKENFFAAVIKKKTKEPDNLIPYAAMFTKLAGTRASEGVALTWDDISDGIIKIKKSEKVIRKYQEETIHYIGETKTKKARIVPVTEEMQKLFYDIREIHRRNNWNSNYIFHNPNGKEEWIRSQTIRDWLRNNGCKCMQAMRATLSAELKNQGVSESVVSSLLGHTIKVNQINYNPDIISLEEKKNALNKHAL